MPHLQPLKKTCWEVQVSNGLYHVKHQEQAFTGTACADEVLTMEELHHCLSHIGPALIHEMLVKGMVDGLKLDPVHETMGQCGSCENPKATCKPISKVCEPQHHEHFGDEVHTDVWGPAQVQTPAIKHTTCPSPMTILTTYTSLSLA
jgi:hypothetical protein